MAPSFAKAAGGDRQAIAAIGDYFAGAPQGLASMVSNHDLFAGERLWDQVGGDRARYRLAAAAYLLAPATPFVYYGEEVGMSAAPDLQGDARVRTPMSWTASGFGDGKAFRSLAGNAAEQNVQAESARPDSLIDWYRGLIELRKSTPALQRGPLEKAWQWQGGWAYSRALEGTHVLVMFNTGDTATAQPVRFLGKAHCAAAFPRERVDGKRIDVGPEADGRAEIPARSLLVLSCTRD
jgi:glycosidase